MTKAEAIYNFWSQFGLPAIDEQSAYDPETLRQLNIDFPYITFQTGIGDFSQDVSLSADLYYRSTSWAEIEAKASEIADYIGLGGNIVRYDSGAVWIKRGNMMYQRMSADNPFDIRRIHININAEFLSA